VTERITHNLDIGSGINLPARVTVTKSMGPRSLWLRCQPDAHSSGRRPFPSQVSSHCLCNCRQKRKLDRHVDLRPTDPQHSTLPVHIFQSNSKDFGCAQTIRCQQQHDRIVTIARRFRSRDRTQDIQHVAPRQTAWGPFIYLPFQATYYLNGHNGCGSHTGH
jgi:hypothetical protein